MADYDHPMSIDDIMKCSFAVARYLSRDRGDRSLTPDNMLGRDDYRQIAACAIWANKDDISKADHKFSFAYQVGKYAIFREYAKSKTLKRQSNIGMRLGTPAESAGDTELPTADELLNAMGDRHRHWLNDLMIREELTVILMNEEFYPSEARIIEGVLQGLSPTDISNEYRIEVNAVLTPLHKAIYRIRDRLGIDKRLPIYLDRDQSINRIKEKEPLLKGGLDIGASSFDAVAKQLSKYEERSKKEKMVTARTRASVALQKLRNKRRLESLSKSQPIKSHRYSRFSHHIYNQRDDVGRGVINES